MALTHNWIPRIFFSIFDFLWFFGSQEVFTSRQIPSFLSHFPKGDIFHNSYTTVIFVSLQQKFIECVCGKAYGKNMGLSITLTFSEAKEIYVFLLNSNAFIY